MITPQFLLRVSSAQSVCSYLDFEETELCRALMIGRLLGAFDATKENFASNANHFAWCGVLEEGHQL